MYVKGNFEPIISEKQWDRCKAIRLSRLRSCTYFTPEGKQRHRPDGGNESVDVWQNKLLCKCGYKMRRNKWRVNQDGEKIYGYKCYNQLNNGSKRVREQAGVAVKGACDLREICDWKLWLMARCIFSAVWGNRNDILDNISAIYKYEYHEEVMENNEQQEEIERATAKLDNKLKNLTEMRMDGEITKDEYRQYKLQIEVERGKLIQERSKMETEHLEERKLGPANSVMKFLSEKIDFTAHRIDKDIIEKFVSRIIPRTESEFEWYLDFDLEYRGVDEKELLWEFQIKFDEARAYRKEINGMLRANQWTDLTVKVFV